MIRGFDVKKSVFSQTELINVVSHEVTLFTPVSPALYTAA